MRGRVAVTVRRGTRARPVLRGAPAPVRAACATLRAWIEGDRAREVALVARAKADVLTRAERAALRRLLDGREERVAQLEAVLLRRTPRASSPQAALDRALVHALDAAEKALRAERANTRALRRLLARTDRKLRELRGDPPRLDSFCTSPPTSSEESHGHP